MLALACSHVIDRLINACLGLTSAVLRSGDFPEVIFCVPSSQIELVLLVLVFHVNTDGLNFCMFPCTYDVEANFSQ